MKKVSSFSDLPVNAAVYAIYGGQEKTTHVAYVGLAKSLKARIIQHLIRRDSSVTTGVNTVNINPDHVTKVAWWQHSSFSERAVLTAAELVAFDILQPVLRSRGNIEEKAKQLYDDSKFYLEMKIVFEGDPTGYLIVPTIQDAFKRILELEKNMENLCKRLENIEDYIKISRSTNLHS